MKKRLMTLLLIPSLLFFLSLFVQSPFMASGETEDIERITGTENYSIPDTLQYLKTLGPEEGMMMALEYFGIEHPEIVYAQAILETGKFKSKGCTLHNNCFGLYNSRQKRYFRFEHWLDSVKAYKQMIQRRYREGENYYSFLRRIGYAEDPAYIKKVKSIVIRNSTLLKG